MKVLWFSNTSCAAFENTDIKGTGGWMISLDKSLQEFVELHIAFNYPYKMSPFKVGKTIYHPIYTGNIILQNLKKRFFNHIIDRDCVDQYMQIIDNVKPDIIHIHGTENSFHRLIALTKIPIIISIQGVLTVIAHKYKSGYQGKYIKEHFGRINVVSIVFGRSSYNKTHKMMQKISYIEQEDLLNAKYIIGRTDWDKRVTRVLAPQSQYFVSNEILRDSFYNNLWDNKIIKDKIIIHTTNGNNYYKGFETICHTLSLLNNLGLDVEWHVAGVSNNSQINKITKKLLKSDYPKKGLVLMGSLNETELVSALKEADIYIMTSHIENSPNNLCEAMILGMPCIATFAGGTASLLTDKQDGLLIQDGDPWAMAGAVLELINNWKTAIQYGISARKRALIRHDKDTIVKELVNIYNTIICK